MRLSMKKAIAYTITVLLFGGSISGCGQWQFQFADERLAEESIVSLGPGRQFYKSKLLPIFGNQAAADAILDNYFINHPENVQQPTDRYRGGVNLNLDESFTKVSTTSKNTAGFHGRFAQACMELTANDTLLDAAMTYALGSVPAMDRPSGAQINAYFGVFFPVSGDPVPAVSDAAESLSDSVSALGLGWREAHRFIIYSMCGASGSHLI